MMDDRAFKGCINTLSEYAEIRKNLTAGNIEGKLTTITQLDELINGIITHLHTNAKGQVT